MRMNEINEILKAVEEINDEINEQLFETDEIKLSVYTDGNGHCVKFCGIRIWHSDDDERKYDDEKDEYESFNIFFRRAVNEILFVMKKINLK